MGGDIKLKFLDSTHPEISLQWHSTLNGNLMPKNVTRGSIKRIWWECDKIKKHVWQATINSRTNTGSGCPYCSGQKVCEDNCLAIINPTIASQWHPILNGISTPYQFTSSSNKKFWWKCKNGHEWQAKIIKRNNGQGCPICAGKKVHNDNCLSTINPELSLEWHPYLNGELTPKQVTAFSGRKVWWKCKRKHEWQAKVNHRNYFGCPYCSGRLAFLDNCLAIINPTIASQWHPILNGILTPYQVTEKSGKKVWWKCEIGHEWKTTICHRTGADKTGCPICNESKGEKLISEILKKIGKNFERQAKYESCRFIRKLPFDFAVIEKGNIFLIEYQGRQHYEPCAFGGSNQNQNENFEKIKKNDKIKLKWANDNGIALLAIPYWEFDAIEERIKEFFNL